MWLKIYYNPITVFGSSMYPTYSNLEKVHGTQIIDNIDRNMVIIADIPESVNYNETVVIKRIVGIAGDHIQIKGNTFFVNEEEYAVHESFLEYDGLDITLKENEIFLLGDNYGYSADSRIYGPILVSDIKYIVKEQKDRKEN
jgi:signal peptidase I